MHRTLRFVALSAFVLTLGSSSLAFGESTGQYIDDATITTKVKAALMTDKLLKPTQVSVETTQGTVKLTGAVDNKDQEVEAVKDANQVNGVKSVSDLITLRNVPSSQEF